MAPHDIDISWQVLRHIVREWAGSSAELAEVTPLSGGCVSTALLLMIADGQRAVLKITPHRVDRSYADEQLQLELFREAGVSVPRVYVCKIGTLDEPFSYILLELMDGMDLGQAKIRCEAAAFESLQAELAEQVLRLHEQSAPQYMRVTTAEPRRYESWAEFFRQTYDPIWQEVEKTCPLPVKCRKLIAKLHERLGRLLAHDDCPRLLHWDLWSSNILAAPSADGRWHVTALLDPHSRYGHAEAELAYLELFHTATPAFLKAYQQSHKLPQEYHRVRKPIYQLYSLLNHLRLFGQEYTKQVVTAVDRVAPLV